MLSFHMSSGCISSGKFRLVCFHETVLAFWIEANIFGQDTNKIEIRVSLAIPNMKISSMLGGDHMLLLQACFASSTILLVRLFLELLWIWCTIVSRTISLSSRSYHHFCQDVFMYKHLHGSLSYPIKDGIQMQIWKAYIGLNIKLWFK